MSGFGVEARMAILRKAADQKMLKPLRTHGWAAEIAAERTNGEFLIVRAKKGEAEHQVALMYSSATDNKHYKELEAETSHIFTNGALYRIESFAHGINIPVAPIDDFFPVMVEWNRKLAPAINVPPVKPRARTARRITAEHPADGIWSHLNQFASVKLAERLIRRRAEQEQVVLTDRQVETKSIGVAFNVRSAVDYFRGVPYESMNKRVLSLYYGCLSLAFAEMLASPVGPTDLDEVEGMTTQGHGLFTVPSATDDLGGLSVGVLATGFFPQWISFLGYDTSGYPRKKAKTPNDVAGLPAKTSTTLGELLGSLPELGNIFEEVHQSSPSWVHVSFDSQSGFQSNHNRSEKASSTYIHIIDRSGRVDPKEIAAAGWSITEITKLAGGEGAKYRARVDHAGFDYWHQVLPLHHSPFVDGDTLILPLLSGVREHRTISLAILYALSILVRYLPSAWRRVEGGDWDQHLVLIRTALNVLERMMPEQFLESITGDRVHSRQPGSFG